MDALGYMFTIAMRCAPSLAYLEKFRQYMAQANEKNLEDETAATLTNKKHVALLAEEDCTVLCTPRFEFQNVADFVLPETLRWLDELELQASFKLQANQLDSAKLARTRKKHHMVYYSRLYINLLKNQCLSVILFYIYLVFDIVDICFFRSNNMKNLSKI